MWISHCGKPVCVCWLMECGYITCVGECVHGGCNVPVAQHKHHESQYQTTTKQTAYIRLLLQLSFADLSIYGPGSKVALFIAHAWGCGRGYGSSLPSPLLPPPAGWVRCKAHHHPSLRVQQVASGGTATLHEIPRAPFTPSAPSAENDKSGSCVV